MRRGRFQSEQREIPKLSNEEREAREAERRRLEACARWAERQAMTARRNNDVEALDHFSKSAMATRRRQR
jgi:hypothetical protein